MMEQQKNTLNELKKMIQILIEENEKLSVAVSELKKNRKKCRKK